VDQSRESSSALALQAPDPRTQFNLASDRHLNLAFCLPPGLKKYHVTVLDATIALPAAANGNLAFQENADAYETSASKKLLDAAAVSRKKWKSAESACRQATTGVPNGDTGNPFGAQFTAPAIDVLTHAPRLWVENWQDLPCVPYVLDVHWSALVKTLTNIGAGNFHIEMPQVNVLATIHIPDEYLDLLCDRNGFLSKPPTSPATTLYRLPDFRNITDREALVVCHLDQFWGWSFLCENKRWVGLVANTDGTDIEGKCYTHTITIPEAKFDVDVDAEKKKKACFHYPSHDFTIRMCCNGYGFSEGVRTDIANLVPTYAEDGFRPLVREGGELPTCANTSSSHGTGGYSETSGYSENVQNNGGRRPYYESDMAVYFSIDSAVLAQVLFEDS
jgi:hypothetical protein